MGAEKQEAKWYGPKYLVVMIMTLLTMLMVGMTVTGMTNTVIPLISEARGWNPQPLYAIVGITSVLDGVLIFFLARVARKSPTRLIGIALIIAAICMFVFGTTKNLNTACIACIICAVCGSAYCSTGAFVLTANWWPTKKGIVLGWTTMGYVLPNILWTPQVPNLYARLGISGTHNMVGIILIVMAVIFLFIVKDTPEQAGVTPDGLTGLDLARAAEVSKELAEYKSPFTVKKLISCKNTWLIAIATGLPLMVGMMYLYSMFAATMSAGYDMATCTIVMTTGGVVSLFGSWFFGFLDQKIGTKKANTFAIILIAIAIISCLLISRGVIFVWIAGMILFCSNGAGRNLLTSFVGTKYGRWDYAAAYQVIGTIACIICGLGTFSPAWFSNYQFMYIVCIVLTVIALIANLLIDDKFVGRSDLI